MLSKCSLSLKVKIVNKIGLDNQTDEQTKGQMNKQTDKQKLEFLELLLEPKIFTGLNLTLRKKFLSREFTFTHCITIPNSTMIWLSLSLEDGCTLILTNMDTLHLA